MLDRYVFKKALILAGISASLLFLGGCATVNVPSIGQNGYAVENDEKRLIKRADEACEILDRTDDIYPNYDLDLYLTGLVKKLLSDNPSEEIKDFDVKVLNDPEFNAFSLPNKRIYINIGALSAADNEAQLATLLGHEVTHIIDRHALKQFRSMENKSAFMSVLEFPLAIAAGSAGVLLGELGVLSSVYGYSQEHEFEADEEGFKRVSRLGYDVRESPKLFQNLSNFLKSEEISQPFFFSTHPKVRERIKKFEQILADSHFVAHDGLILDTPDFQKYAFEIYTKQIQLCLNKGMFKTAEQNYDHLSKKYADRPETFYWGGEITRLRQDHDKRSKKRDKTADFPEAIKRYDMALKINPDFRLALAGKARCLDKMGQKDKAKELFRKYIELNPGASDRGYIEQYIKG